MLNKVDSQLGDGEDYVECMKNHGDDLPAGETEGYGQLLRYLDGLAPVTADTPPPNSAGTLNPNWQSFLDRETELLSHDKACRQDKYEQGIALLVDPLNSFLNSHHDSLQRIEHDWNDILSEAEAGGFDASPYN